MKTLERVLAVAGIALLSLLLTVRVAAADQRPDDKITICHAAGLEGTTKYVTLTLAPSAVFANPQGQGGHFLENGTTQAGHEQDTLGACPTTTTEGPNETTTTTAPPTTTTSEAPTTTTAPEATTTSVTSVDSTTTTPAVVVTTIDKAAVPGKATLPYTGIDPTFLVGLAAVLGASGAYLVRKYR